MADVRPQQAALPNDDQATDPAQSESRPTFHIAEQTPATSNGQGEVDDAEGQDPAAGGAEAVDAQGSAMSLRSQSNPAPAPNADDETHHGPTTRSGRVTRQRGRGGGRGGGRGRRRFKVAPRLKLNLRSAGGAGGARSQGPKTLPYMQGYDRELDSSDDETGQGLAFEEQLVLRMPPGVECDMLREAVRERKLGAEGGPDVEVKFKDSRRALFRVGQALFAARLVDLPAIVESHKTLDNRQLFKIADISQMLLVTHRIADESEVTRGGAGGADLAGVGSGAPEQGATEVDEYLYPHGITPPMRFCRKRRFRKRAHKRTIETVEKEVERLLEEDKKAERVEFHMIDPAQAEAEDAEESRRGANRGGMGAASDAPTPATPRDGQMGDEEEEEEDGGVDLDLAAELEAALDDEESDEESDEDDDEDDEDRDSSSGDDDGASSRQGSSRRAASEEGDLWGGAGEGDESGGEGDDDDAGAADDLDEEEAERRVREQQLDAECREIEALVRKQQAEANNTVNAILKKRRLDALKRLTNERDVKRNQLAALKQERKRREAEAKESAEQEAAAAAAAAGGATGASPTDVDGSDADADADADAAEDDAAEEDEEQRDGSAEAAGGASKARRRRSTEKPRGAAGAKAHASSAGAAAATGAATPPREASGSASAGTPARVGVRKSVQMELDDGDVDEGEASDEADADEGVDEEEGGDEDGEGEGEADAEGDLWDAGSDEDEDAAGEDDDDGGTGGGGADGPG